MVGVTGLEPAAWWSQTTRSTSWATPRFCIEFLSFCVEVGQTVVKPDFYAFLWFCKVPKTRINKGFFALLIFWCGEVCSRSQSTRSTSWATPRFCIEFLCFCVEVGQTVVKSDFYAFLRFCKVPKMPVLQGFFALLLFKNGVTCSRSQSKRATNCATSRWFMILKEVGNT